MAFKSVRLLNDAIHKEMDALRKVLMSTEPGAVTDDGQTALETVNVLRNLFDELAAKADRPTIEDVTKLTPGDYVATMKPLVRTYHQQLMTVDLLAPCLCEDLQANGCIIMLIGAGKTVVKTAIDPNSPEEVKLAVEAVLATLDGGIQQVVTEGVAEAEKQLGITTPPDGECKVAAGLMEPDPRSGGCDHPTCMRCYPEPGDPPLPEPAS